MYEFVKGIVVEITPHHVSVDVQGVGYKLLIPVSIFGRVDVGNTSLFYTSFVVRENFQGLYGFLEKEERNLFEQLIALSGIGPKTALNLIGHLPLEEFRHAIATENSKLLSKVPGIGKKTADRLIVDLQGKFLKTSSHTLASPQLADAVSALLHLGYNAQAAECAIKAALKELPEGVPLSTLLATALKNRV